jgi:hypothetical protein
VSEAALNLCPVDNLEWRVVERGHHAARALIKSAVPRCAQQSACTQLPRTQVHPTLRTSRSA